MIYRGKVTNGQIVLEKDVTLPEGAAVEVSIRAEPDGKPRETDRQTLFDVFQTFVGSIDDLPADMSINHDHYLYGAPKRT